MQSLALSSIHAHPPHRLPTLRWLDRIALSSGIALIRWVDRSQQHRHTRPDDTARRSQLALRQSEQDRETAVLRASTVFPSVR